MRPYASAVKIKKGEVGGYPIGTKIRQTTNLSHPPYPPSLPEKQGEKGEKVKNRVFLPTVVGKNT